jgi:predicted peptidase
LVDTPVGFDSNADTKYPLLLFLHGAGERGSELSQVKKHGPHKYVAEHQLPVITVSPQCPDGQWWDAPALVALVDALEKEWPIDTDRIYVTGLSMGGFGTWEMLRLAPHRFAAAAPICGGGNPESVGTFKHVPLWVFHGGKDNVVPLDRSQAMVDALEQQGSQVKFTIYPEAGHDSWTETYNDPKFYEWLLDQRSRP